MCHSFSITVDLIWRNFSITASEHFIKQSLLPFVRFWFGENAFSNLFRTQILLFKVQPKVLFYSKSPLFIEWIHAFFTVVYLFHYINKALTFIHDSLDFRFDENLRNQLLFILLLIWVSIFLLFWVSHKTSLSISPELTRFIEN